MFGGIKRYIFRKLSFESYLRLLQRSYFALYNTNFLRLSKSYNYHYNVKKLIKKGDTVIDIGANLGYYSILFARWVGDSGKVYAVEPIKVFNEIFSEKACKYNNIVLYPYALGSEEKPITLVTSPKTGYFRTGLPHIHDEERDGDIENAEYSFEAQMKIPSKLFGSLEKIDYIKCDVEGFEYIVLSDMKNLIKRHKPKVQVEVWGQNEKQMIELFTEMGYIPYKFKTNKLQLLNDIRDKIEGDYIFIHRDQIKQ